MDCKRCQKRYRKYNFTCIVRLILVFSLHLIIQTIPAYTWKLRLSEMNDKGNENGNQNQNQPFQNNAAIPNKLGTPPRPRTSWPNKLYPIPQPERTLSLFYIDVFTIPTFLKSMSELLRNVLWYKPPVGFVALFCGLRLVWTGRLWQRPQLPEDGGRASLISRPSQHNVPNILPMDTDDVLYRQYGSVEAIRHRLIRAVWQDCVRVTTKTTMRIMDEPSTNTIESTSPSVPNAVVEVIINALDVPHLPGQSPWYLVHDLIHPIAQIECLIANSSPRTLMQGLECKQLTSTTAELHQLLGTSVLSLQVHTLDALLRVCRNRLLQSCRYLQRSQNYWKRRSTTHFGMFLPRRTIQRRLAEATASYQAEVQKLGRVAQLLYKRPSDLEYSDLLRTLKQGKIEHDDTTYYDDLVNNDALSKDTTISGGLQRRIFRTVHNLQQSLKTHWPTRWSLNQFSLPWLWWTHNSSRVSDYDADIDPELAKKVILESTSSSNWINDARDWTFQARQTLCDVVEETLTVSEPTPRYNIDDFHNLKYNWCVQKYETEEPLDIMWMRLLAYVDAMPSWTRLGKGSRLVRVRDFFLLLLSSENRRSVVDYRGVPSTLATIGLANYIHMKVAPHWPALRADARYLSQKTMEIIKERAWVPMKGIYDDIMDKNPGLTAAFGINIEETSLDHMLRDLGCGDGTSATREIAIKQATEMYEQQLRSGLILNIARGQLIRLLLIQVQQLKVGMLSALETIDVLLKGNRINLQIMAAIPAVVIVTYGTRLFLRSLYNIRSRDLRPLTAVHAEMARLLQDMQEILISSQGGTVLQWEPHQLGALLLVLHRYLVLLDYASPPLASRSVERLAEMLQNLLGREGVLRREDSSSTSFDRQWQSLQIIQLQHRELVK